jgi:hypothetical protein
MGPPGEGNGTTKARNLRGANDGSERFLLHSRDLDAFSDVSLNDDKIGRLRALMSKKHKLNFPSQTLPLLLRNENNGIDRIRASEKIVFLAPLKYTSSRTCRKPFSLKRGEEPLILQARPHVKRVWYEG